jgi:hypothetical protein
MRKVCILLAAIVAGASLSGLSEGAGAVRISQVYSGGGSAPSYEPQAYRTDYIELFNASGSPVDVSGWFLAYGGATDTPNYGCAGCTGLIPEDFIIGPCSYLLIQVGTPNPRGSAPDVPSPDVVLAVPDLTRSSMGSLGLFIRGPQYGMCPTYTRVDLVAWDSYCSETRPAAGPDSRAEALVRRAGGMIDTDDNRADFELVTSPVPRGSASPQNPECLGTPTGHSTWGRLKTVYR